MADSTNTVCGRGMISMSYIQKKNRNRVLHKWVGWILVVVNVVIVVVGCCCCGWPRRGGTIDKTDVGNHPEGFSSNYGPERRKCRHRSRFVIPITLTVPLRTWEAKLERFNRKNSLCNVRQVETVTKPAWFSYECDGTGTGRIFPAQQDYTSMSAKIWVELTWFFVY